PIHDGVQRLQVVRAILHRPQSILISAGYGYELCGYMAASYDRYCQYVDWSAVQSQLAAGSSLRQVLVRDHVSVVYVDPVLGHDAAIAPLLANPAQSGFREVSAGASPTGPWAVLVRG